MLDLIDHSRRRCSFEHRWPPGVVLPLLPPLRQQPTRLPGTPLKTIQPDLGGMSSARRSRVLMGTTGAHEEQRLEPRPAPDNVPEPGVVRLSASLARRRPRVPVDARPSRKVGIPGDLARIKGLLSLIQELRKRGCVFKSALVSIAWREH